MATRKRARASGRAAGAAASGLPCLRVKNFGPLRECALPVSGMVVLIGEQASGKSTLAKLLYFFQSMPEMVEDNGVRLARGAPFENWVKLVRQRFMESFGTAKHMPSFEIEYRYSARVTMKLGLEKGSGHVLVEPDKLLREAVVERIELERRRAGPENGSQGDPLRASSETEASAPSDSRRALRRLTGCESERLFIPSARSLLSVLSSDLLFTDLPSLDPLMQRFVQRIGRLQREFTRSLEEQIDMALHASLRDVPLDQERLSTAIRIIRSVLKGEYVHDGHQDHLLLDGGQQVHLRFASSGQQEALWILLVLFSIMLHGTPATVIMEEPEAHLFPFAQRDVVNLVALCKNMAQEPGAARNAAVLTTHSPYVLSAMNNLLYAWQTGNSSTSGSERTAAIVDRQLWLDPDDTGVWFVEKGGIRSIMDPELRLIRAEEIDGVSSALRSEFDALAEIEGA